MTTNPFTTPATVGTGVKWAELNGHLLVIEPKSVDNVATAYGTSDAVRADLHDLDTGDEYPDILIFPKILISQTRSRVGQMILGRLGQGTARPGQSAPWKLVDPTPADIAQAQAWLDKRQRPTFAQPAQPQQYDRPPF